MLARGLPLGLVAACVALPVLAQGGLNVPRTVEAGSAFTVQSSGSGQGTLYIVGPGQVLKRDIQLGSMVEIAAGSLYNAGHYVVTVSGGSGESASLDVLPASKPADVSFLARPSRLPVGLHDGITGAVYLFDTYHNLITVPTPVAFQLSASGSAQNRSVTTRNGTAWVSMDSSPKEGAAQFSARVGDISATRIIGQVPGDPCGLQMTAKPAAGSKVDLETAPVRDCSGNAVPDGTIVTFTATYDGAQTTVDVPLKRGVAKVQMPAHPGAMITVASGVVLGNQIRWSR